MLELGQSMLSAFLSLFKHGQFKVVH